MTSDPANLQLILAEVSAAVRRAYSEGYRQGSQEAADKMMRAVSTNLDQRMPALLNEDHSPPPDVPSGRMSPPRQGVPSGARSFRYGSVIGAFREALLATPDAGISREELIEYCRRRNIDVTVNQYRDTMKRLTGGEEVERHNGVYFPGRRLRPDLAGSQSGDGQLFPAQGSGNIKTNTGRFTRDAQDVDSVEAEG